MDFFSDLFSPLLDAVLLYCLLSPDQRRSHRSREHDESRHGSSDLSSPVLLGHRRSFSPDLHDAGRVQLRSRSSDLRSVESRPSLDLSLLSFSLSLSGFFMVRPTNSRCCSQLRTRSETATFRRAGPHLTTDRESKLTTIRTNYKVENPFQRDAAIECQL